MADDDAALQKFRADLQASLKRNQEAFDGKYQAQLQDLLGLSEEDLQAIVPDVTGQADYAKLIAVVKEASRHNVSQAELTSQIQALGQTAISIARSVAVIL